MVNLYFQKGRGSYGHKYTLEEYKQACRFPKNDVVKTERGAVLDDLDTLLLDSKRRIIVPNEPNIHRKFLVKVINYGINAVQRYLSPATLARKIFEKSKMYNEGINGRMFHFKGPTRDRIEYYLRSGEDVSCETQC